MKKKLEQPKKEFPDALQVLVQFQGEEVERFLTTRNKSIFARRTRVNAAFARNLIFERIAQLEAEAAAQAKAV